MTVHITGTKIAFLKDGEWTTGDIESYNSMHGTYVIRTKDGQLRTVMQEHCLTEEEYELEINKPPMHEFEHEGHNSGHTESKIKTMLPIVLKYVAIIGIGLILIAIGLRGSTEEKPTEEKPKSKIQINTEKINSLNLENATMAESCAKVRENRVQIKKLLTEINNYE